MLASIKFSMLKTSELLKNNDSDYFKKEFLDILNEDLIIEDNSSFIYFPNTKS
jgi:hypothetical protein